MECTGTPLLRLSHIIFVTLVAAAKTQVLKPKKCREYFASLVAAVFSAARFMRIQHLCHWDSQQN